MSIFREVEITPSKALFFFCISFIAGVAAECAYKIPQNFLWYFLCLLACAMAVAIFMQLRRRIKIFWLCFIFCPIFMMIGILRMQISEFNMGNDGLKIMHGKDIAFTAIVQAEPDVRDTYQKLKIKYKNSIILVNARRYPEYKYMDVLKIAGTLEEPQQTDDFSYKNYLMKDGIYSVMNFPEIYFVGNKRGTFYEQAYFLVLFMKNKMRQSIRSNFSVPYSSILEGTVLGDNGAMSEDLKNKLNATGLRHIIAVSGTHVVILAQIIMFILLALGFWRNRAFYIAIIFISFYIILTGMPSSGIRAGIMGGLYLLAQKLGRQSMGPRVVAMACAAMLAANPRVLFYDVGFQLSFLAVLGLIYLEPLIKKIINIIAKNRARNFVGIVSTTLAAQIFTLPVMIFNFGNISFVAPLTNLLIAPTVSLLMIFGFLSCFAGLFFAVLAKVFSVPCWFFLAYFKKIIDLFSQPWAIKNIQNVHWAWLVAAYVLLVVLTRWLNKRFAKFA